MRGNLRDMAVTVEQERQSSVVRWMFERPLWYLTFSAVAVTGLLYGIGPVPYLALDYTSPFAKADPSPENVEPGTPLAWIIGHLVGIRTQRQLVLFDLALVVGCVMLSVYLVARWVSDYAARLFLAGWFASPLANVNLTWLGKPDHFTILATVLIGVGPPSACAAGGALLGFNHFEQGIFLVAGTILIRGVFRRERPWRWLWHMLAGFVAGRAVWMVYAAYVDYDPSKRFDWITRDGLGPFVHVWRANIPSLLFGAFGVGWAAVIYMWQHVGRRDRYVIAAAMIVATVPALVTLDTTRVYSLLALPTLVGCVVWLDRHADRAVIAKALPWFLLAAIFVPRLMLWVKEPYVSSWDRPFFLT